MIEVNGLAKNYGTIQALDDVDFRIAQGEIVGLLGPNGAGKTTLIKILTGYLHPDRGTITVNGFDVLDQTIEVQRQIGYLPENAPLYPELTVQSYLQMMAELHQIEEEQQVEAILEAAHATGLYDRLTQRIGTLSKGYRQRVGIAQAIMHKPALLIFDEPTVGLDPTQIVEVRSLIRALAQHSTIIFSTHILAEVEALCDRALILLNGALRADSVIKELRGASHVMLVLKSDVPNLKPVLARTPAIGTVEKTASDNRGIHYRIDGENPLELSAVVYQIAKDQDWPVLELYNEVATLESTFNSLALAA